VITQPRQVRKEAAVSMSLCSRNPGFLLILIVNPFG
jgi:hypothetical protein